LKQGDVSHQFVAVAKVAIGRRRADSGLARGFGECGSGRPLGRDQFQRRADQRLAQVAVVISARFVPPAIFVAAPVCVTDIYM
jgi:hypothetical protein